jgi:hypothetical protein
VVDESVAQEGGGTSKGIVVRTRGVELQPRAKAVVQQAMREESETSR